MHTPIAIAMVCSWRHNGIIKRPTHNALGRCVHTARSRSTAPSTRTSPSPSSSSPSPCSQPRKAGGCRRPCSSHPAAAIAHNPQATEQRVSAAVDGRRRGVLGSAERIVGAKRIASRRRGAVRRLHAAAL